MQFERNKHLHVSCPRPKVSCNFLCLVQIYKCLFTPNYARNDVIPKSYKRENAERFFFSAKGKGSLSDISR